MRNEEFSRPAARPLVGVPTQTLQAIDGIPEGLPHSWVMNHRYLTALALVGAAPVLVPLLEGDLPSLRSIYQHLDGLFLAGGVDVDPASYGEPLHEATGRTDADRDEVELTLARWALEDGMPVLGVCRGMQILNIVRGGSLLQDTGIMRPGMKHDYFPTEGFARDYLAHAVAPAAGSQVAMAFGESDFLVNSMHHQAIDRMGEGLCATAHAADGLVEALEVPGERFAVGVQWHPEVLIERDSGTRRLFEAFTRAASAFSRQTA
jgi:putative glutamine amidotransferase